MSQFQTGQIVDAEVTRVEQYGAFLQHEGIEIVVLVPEVTWQVGCLADDIVKIGDEVRVLLLNPYSDESARWAGSIKQVLPNPYQSLSQDIGSQNEPKEEKGKIIRLNDRSITIEIPSGAQGHAIGKKGAHYKVGDLILVRIVSLDAKQGLLRLEILGDADDP